MELGLPFLSGLVCLGLFWSDQSERLDLALSVSPVLTGRDVCPVLPLVANPVIA